VAHFDAPHGVALRAKEANLLPLHKREIRQRAASPTVRTSLVACRLPSGTILFPPPAAHRHRPQQPHSPCLPRFAFSSCGQPAVLLPDAFSWKTDRGYVLELGRNRFEGTGQALSDPDVKRLYLGG